MVKAEENHAALVPLPDHPAEEFCGIFKDGSSLCKALLADRKNVTV